MRGSRAIFIALLALLLTACAPGKFKAPKCKGSYVPVNTPEHYLKDLKHE